MAEVGLPPGTLADVSGLRALGEAVVPATSDAIDAAYAQRMLAEVERVAASPWPADVWMRKDLGRYAA